MAQTPDDRNTIPDDPTDRAAYFEGLEKYWDCMIGAYWRCNGDRNAMADWIIRTEFADVVEGMRYQPPATLDGETYPPEQVLRELVRLRSEEAIAWIEGHGDTRH